MSVAQLSNHRRSKLPGILHTKLSNSMMSLCTTFKGRVFFRAVPWCNLVFCLEMEGPRTHHTIYRMIFCSRDHSLSTGGCWSLRAKNVANNTVYCLVVFIGLEVFRWKVSHIYSSWCRLIVCLNCISVEMREIPAVYRGRSTASPDNVGIPSRPVAATACLALPRCHCLPGNEAYSIGCSPSSHLADARHKHCLLFAACRIFRCVTTTFVNAHV